ncbi:MAG: hypothetical protein R2824_10110 [Saprospiraceae bacterium]|nr:hypothetical protein [Lewinella sp.]
MLTNNTITKLSAIVTLSIFIFCSAFTVKESLPWQRLGFRTVNFQLDRDEIPVTLASGTFNSVKLLVHNSPLHMHRFVIHFSNGGTQEVLVRERIPKGGETRIIDLKGGNRGIKKVVFWYDTGNLARGKAIIELWGRH